MNSEVTTPRRQFLGRMAGAAAAAGITRLPRARRSRAETSAPDAWIAEVKGTHKCLFDFPQHKNAFPLLHILNYINTYAAGVQDRSRRGGHRRDLLQRGQPGQHSAGVWRRRSGPSTPSAPTPD